MAQALIRAAPAPTNTTTVVTLLRNQAVRKELLEFRIQLLDHAQLVLNASVFGPQATPGVLSAPCNPSQLVRPTAETRLSITSGLLLLVVLVHMLI